MTEERLQAFRIILCETQKPELIKIANELGNPKFKQGLKKRLLEKKLNTILESAMDKESFSNLSHATKIIEKLNSKLISTEGWYTSRWGASQFDSEDEYRKYYPTEIIPNTRLFHVERDENGYHLGEEVPNGGSIYNISRLTEENFLKKFASELAMLHTAHTIKEKIMGGEYQVNPEYAEIVEFICEYFGYTKLEPELTVINK